MFLQKKFTRIALFAFAIFTSSIEASDFRDGQGRTQLMNYVIATQNEIADITTDIRRLYNVCYETVTIHTQGYNRTYTRVETRRRACCLDKDIEAHRQRTADLVTFKKTSFAHIALLVEESDEDTLLARDNQGMTVLNHCAHQEIYNILRDHGAPFQYDAFAYNYRGELIVSSVILTVITVALYKNGYLSKAAFIQLGKNIESGAITTLQGLKDFVSDPINNSINVMSTVINGCIDAIYYTTLFIWNNTELIVQVTLDLN